ncbi:EF-hand domain-containing family member C2 [Trypanosoma rangeli]|uniref:EF-hand domain-containing family member C2 n=1 Tax=Trypanosoma rangeli TaxID=5698 RepID=A0A3R7KM50_TRYRA|nr:EF-hand domain-containing family member C2 [Trypanosoma rangeli]RNF04345.1 EF-hand domain-containing family member C2 [Trypanosoma rangeli]|eukprot:RNF04345.1 EF-hand domain-containing family member C2 [Trypanosoma rangeli]
MNSQRPVSLRHDVPTEYIRALDPKLLPPRVGHNWLDPAFRKVQDKPQQLEAELRGKRAFISKGVYDHTPPERLGRTAQQLMHALSTRRKVGIEADRRAQYTTLADKVLRFYAFFTEKAPEGCLEEYWHRRVVIDFFPEDDTVLIQEPPIPNSGLRGGTFLKRQRVRADPRQREEFPDDEFLTLNHFNVGRPVRINAVEFFLYDCDLFTREFLTALGVNVASPVTCPDSSFMSDWKRHQERMLSAKFGILSQDFHGDEAVRAARFVQDSGKVLRFYSLLDERNKVAGGIVRKLEVLYFVEDDSMAVVERPTSNEATPSLFLSRGWVPKEGSIAKANELTFAHRVNGMREPYIGPEGHYTARDLGVGITINVLGRHVFLYDCDDFTRSYYLEKYGVILSDAVDCRDEYGLSPESRVTAFRLTATPASVVPTGRDDAVLEKRTECKMKDVLRFLLRLAPPCSAVERQRRFTLTYYTDTDEAMVCETVVRNSGFLGGCFCSRKRLPKPVGSGEAYYTVSDFPVGAVIVVNGHRFEVVNMDEHTANYLAGENVPGMNEEQLQLLITAFRLFLETRFHTFKDAFLGFDRDKDGVVSVTEFVNHLQELQITGRRMDGQALFDHIAPFPETGYLTMEDLLKWMSETATNKSQKTHEPIDVEERTVVRKALQQLCMRLEARCLNSLQMFRLASTMPRAYTERRADIYSLANPNRDASVTPVQLRRCIEEVVGGNPAPREMDALLAFFFPRLPPEEYRNRRDVSLEHALDLKAFQKKYHEMNKLLMLPDMPQQQQHQLLPQVG